MYRLACCCSHPAQSHPVQATVDVPRCTTHQTASPVVPPAPVCQLIRCKQLCLIVRHAVEDVEECVLQGDGYCFQLLTSCPAGHKAGPNLECLPACLPSCR